MSLRHVLVATDFSPIADAALDRAIAIAKLHAARMTLAYAEAVVEPGPPGENESAAAAELERIRAAGIEVETAVRGGSPDEAITELAKANGVNLIVIGTHGRTGIGRFLLGSVAELIVRRAS